MPTRIPLINRILYDAKTGCWNWKGTKNKGGYGTACFNSTVLNAHRLAAHLWLGFSLNDPRRVLHRCDNPACFNPKHLFIGTQKENLQDMTSKGRHHNQVKTRCKHGHPYGGDNNYRLSDGRRQCLVCRRFRDKARPFLRTVSLSDLRSI